MNRARMRRGEAIQSDVGPLCAYCGDTIFTIGYPGERGTIERRSRTGRRLRRDTAYCSADCRREQYRSFVRDCVPSPAPTPAPETD